MINSPQPLTIKLGSIDELSPLQKYLEKKPEVLSNIKKALHEYCESLKSEGAVSSCKKPEPDPPFPKSKFSCFMLFFVVAVLCLVVFDLYKLTAI